MWVLVKLKVYESKKLGLFDLEIERLSGRVVEKLRYLMSAIWESESFVAG